MAVMREFVWLCATLHDLKIFAFCGDVMLEINPIMFRIKDLAARAASLRGYL
jgi:hypothetical protein